MSYPRDCGTINYQLQQHSPRLMGGWWSDWSDCPGSKFCVVAPALRQGILKTRVTFIPQFFIDQLSAPIGQSTLYYSEWTNGRRCYIGWTATLSFMANYASPSPQNRCGGSVTIWRRVARPDVKVLSTKLNWIYTTWTQ